MFGRCISSTTMVFFVLANSGNAQQDRAVFDNAAVVAEWAFLAAKITSLRYEERTEFYTSENAGEFRLTRKDVAKYVCSQAGRRFEYEVTELDPSGIAKRRRESAQISNLRYKASLSRPGKGGGWLLSKLDLTKTAVGEVDFCSKLAVPWDICGPARLSGWMLDPSFVVTSASVVGAGPGRVIRVHFVYEHAKRNKNTVPGDRDVPDVIRSGHIDFDAEHSYCILAHEFQIQSGAIEYIERGQMSYRFGDLVPVLRERTLESSPVTRPQGGSLSQREVSTYAMEYNVSVADDELRLSYFDLPEPMGVTWPSPIRWYLWFIGAGVACLAGGVYLWRRVESRKVATIQRAEKPPAE
jgi:hypothetical protein